MTADRATAGLARESRPEKAPVVLVDDRSG